MRNLLLILLPLFLLMGCGNTLKNSWNNFTAYYNTFYNAKEHYKAGIKKVNNQPVSIDPEEPVRIHSAPVQAGSNDFQQAIEKGARVLRKFPDSKWADDAILLIGKSYYYRKEFFPAIEKFEELRNIASSFEIDQQAVIWKGRTQLDVRQYSEGIGFLESELEQYPNDKSVELKGEIQSLLAQHHVMLQHWDEAAGHLFDAVENISDKKLLGRTYFLLGQVLEQLDRFGESFNAFGSAAENFPDFEYLYWSRYKQADIARKAGRYNLALKILQSLLRDDKNLQRRGVLRYEIAHTYELMGEIEVAEQRFKDLLYGNRNQQQTRELKGDIYFRLGKIYSDHFDRYQVAAAYFDSASTARTQPDRQTNGEDATALADVYGEYTKLQETIDRVDSLLHLGSLSEQELDSALQRIRQQKMEALQSRQSQEDEANSLANIQAQDDIEEAARVPTQYGYLNYRNPELVEQSKTQFRLIWGNRPLVDNWRNVRAIRNMDESGQTGRRDDRKIAQNDQNGKSMLEMNLEDIPRTPEQRSSLEREKVSAQYGLGNMLFLNLNMPDSARFYFHRVINSGDDTDLRPRAMYSLFELFSTQDKTDSLNAWGQRIIEEYPETRYARRVESRLTGKPAGGAQNDSTAQLLEQYQEISKDTTDRKAARLRKLALANSDAKLAPKIFYHAIEDYIQQAKAADRQFAFHDTALAGVADDSVVAADTLQLNLASEEQLTFNGAQWDSVRLAIQQFDTAFPNAQYRTRVMKLQKLLQQKRTPEDDLPTCGDLGITLRVKPNIDSFLSKVNYSDKLKGKSLSGNVEYMFPVTSDGQVQSYELLSQKTSLGIEEAFEEAFDAHLKFEAIELEDSPKKVRCRVRFPIKH